MEIISLSDTQEKNIYEFPLDVFPVDVANAIKNVCEGRSLPIQFVGTSALWTLSTLAGRRYYSEFGNAGVNILYCLLVAPVSVGKTPSIKVVAENPLKEAYKQADADFIRQLEQYQHGLKDKDKGGHLQRPKRYVPIVAEATTEGIVHKHMSQPVGIGVYYDEAESIFSAGNYKSTNDAVTFFTKIFSGGRYEQIRADDDKERVIPSINVNLIMGTQPERLGNVFTEDRLSSGFASRFLTVKADYQPLNENIDPFGQAQSMGDFWRYIVEGLFFAAFEGRPMVEVHITDSAKELYRSLWQLLMREANERILSRAENYLIGAEAKLTAYLPRFCQILAILNNKDNPLITTEIVNNAFILYRYYQQSSIEAISGMKREADSGLPVELDNLYQMLPEHFTLAQAKTICVRLGLNERRFETSLRKKDFSALFRRAAKGEYSKI